MGEPGDLCERRASGSGKDRFTGGPPISLAKQQIASLSLAVSAREPNGNAPSDARAPPRSEGTFLDRACDGHLTRGSLVGGYPSFLIGISLSSGAEGDRIPDLMSAIQDG
jgi:hypothetical protein